MSAQRMLSEPEAWREVARRIAVVRDPGERRFLCLEVDDLWYAERISDERAAEMRGRVRLHLADLGYEGGPAYHHLDGSIPELRHARILAALWLALEAEEEANG